MSEVILFALGVSVILAAFVLVFAFGHWMGRHATGEAEYARGYSEGWDDGRSARLEAPDA